MTSKSQFRHRADMHRRTLRDATGPEIADEPDAVLADLANGTLEATWTTRALAIVELERRVADMEARAAK